MTFNESAVRRQYFNDRVISWQSDRPQGPRGHYISIKEGDQKYFLKVTHEQISAPEKYKFFLNPCKHLLPLIPTFSGNPFFEDEGLSYFLHPYIEGRDFDPKTDDAISLAGVVGSINLHFSNVKENFGRANYADVNDLDWTPELAKLIRTNYQTSYDQDDYDSLKWIADRYESLAKSDFAFEYADCHPSNLRLDDKGVTIVDLDSFCTVPQGTAIGLMIERMAKNLNHALDIYGSYTKASGLKLSFDEVLLRSQIETMRRMNFILGEIRRTGKTEWPNDISKHLLNLRKTEGFRRRENENGFLLHSR